MPSVTVTILGAGDAFASKGLCQSGYVINGSDCRILMDPGPTVLGAMKRAGIPPGQIDTILVSHLHGDHFGGLPFLILEYMYESPRRRRLTIAGPRGLERRTWALFRSMFPESDATGLARKLNFVVLRPHSRVRVGPATVTSIRTPHTVKDVSLAFRIVLDGKTVAFSGDTGWTEELVGLSAGADLFLCECTYFDSTNLAFHLNYPELAANRGRLSPRRIILTHLGREVLERKSQVKLEMASDLMTVRL